MGMKIFTASGTFTPSDYGLAVGDLINVICVGGGSSGNSGGSAYTGNNGTISSFGALLSAAGGISPNSGNTNWNGMGRGGLGVSNLPGGGAGGYEPGWPIMGGNGGQADNTSPTTTMVTLYTAVPSGLGGKGGFATGTYKQLGPCNSMWANMSEGGPGNRGAGPGYNNYSSGGNGYGAGGGGGAISNPYGCGGNSGVFAQGTFNLTSTAGIAVTVGTGGATASNAGAGAPGVVIVFW